ncbi:hypothetical protein P8452_66296 [Trifolium repens]|nr:hypothetical protein P8452_66296 [Trifolium repens]
MIEEQENRLLVMVVRDLLNLCEIMKGKDNKAVIASNIMIWPLDAAPNQKWLEIIGQVHQNVEFLKDQDVIRTVLNILQRNKNVASSLGTFFLPQITLIFLDMLNVYRSTADWKTICAANDGSYYGRFKQLKLQ